jgi:hypothetical protein
MPFNHIVRENKRRDIDEREMDNFLDNSPP